MTCITSRIAKHFSDSMKELLYVFNSVLFLILLPECTPQFRDIMQLY